MDVEIGSVSKHLSVVDLVIRTVGSSETIWLEEATGEETPDGLSPRTVDKSVQHLQGHLRNATSGRLSNVRCDLSYYDSSGAFLGLDRAEELLGTEISPGEQAAIDLELKVPEGTARYVFNARACRPGLIARMFWG